MNWSSEEGSAHKTASGARGGGDVELVQLTDRVWTASYSTYRTLVIDADQSVVAVNTFEGGPAAIALRELLSDAFPGKPVSTAIQTIDHLDHTGGGRELHVAGDVIGHRLTADLVHARGARGQLPISRVVDGPGATMNLDGVDVELIYPGPTLGSGNLAVFVPDDSVMFVVGPQSDARYGLFPDFHLRHVTSAWRLLAGREPKMVVPGRYECFAATGLVEAADYLDALARSCQQAFVQGLPIWEVDTMGNYVRSELQEQFGNLDGFDEHIATAAIRVVHYYLMGGWGLEDSAHPDRLLS